MEEQAFAIFILTHNRADKVYTYKTLLKTDYDGEVFLIVDDEDPQLEKYKEKFGDKVLTFSKAEIAKEFDIMDNFSDMRAVVYARNATFGIAKMLGVKYFMVLDDDYSGFYYRFDRGRRFISKKILRMNDVLQAMVNFMKTTNVKSIAMAQSGDFIGGDNGFCDSITMRRKCMNTFLCVTDRPFNFIGRINEDVNTYVNGARLGDIFLTIPVVAIQQKATQANTGGLTEIYLALGTYVKSFYTVMVSPSSVKVAPMGDSHMRVHHRIKGVNTYPMIIREEHKHSTK